MIHSQRTPSTRFLALRSAFLVIAPAMLACAAAGCVNPHDDFDKWIDNTNGKRGVVAVDAAGVDTLVEDTGPNIADVNGTFLVSCLPTLAGGAAELSILFYGEITLTGDQVSVVLSPLLETATKMSKSQVTGTPLTAPPAAVVGLRTFELKYGAGTVPGNSQRIGDSNLVFTNFALQSKIQNKDRLCAELQGELTSPFPQDFNGVGDYCVFVRLADGVDLPTATNGTKTWVGFTAAEHNCP
jgi:hypothetical protein